MMKIHKKAFVHSSAVVMGAVELGEKSSVWPMTVVRADLGKIRIGRFVNIQDGSILHCNTDNQLEIGDYTLVGHKAMLHGCKIGKGCLIGINATVLDNAEIGDGAMIMAGCTIRGGKKIPPRALVLPAGDKVKIMENKATPLVTVHGSLEYAELAKLAKKGNKKLLSQAKLDELKPLAEQIVRELDLS